MMMNIEYLHGASSNAITDLAFTVSNIVPRRQVQSHPPLTRLLIHHEDPSAAEPQAIF
jgi:hypothetical protein